MDPDNAYGPDGFSPAFFQHFWDLVGREVFKYYKNWLDDNAFLAELNNRNLILISKEDNMEKITDVRKILKNVLAYRLKRVLPTTISQNQSSFVPCRSITSNVLIAFEMIHYMKKKKDSQDGDATLKLYISKAYDRVN